MLGRRPRRCGSKSLPLLTLNRSFLAYLLYHPRIVKERPSYQVILVDHRGHGDSPTFDPPHTVDSTAVDLKRLMNHLNISPDVIIGHSFGGKVALGYVQLCQEIGDDLPSAAWIIDSLPRTLQSASPSNNNDESVTRVIGILRSIKLPIPSRDSLVNILVSHGLSKGLGMWMTTNISPVEGGGYTWRFDLDVIDQLFDSFLGKSFYPFLLNPPAHTTVNFIRASRNPLWTQQDLDDFAKFESVSKGGVRLHALEGGHWLHVDNPEGLYKMIGSTL
jgi:pimeloyl-ACP methyl ester carboxylesterase